MLSNVATRMSHRHARPLLRVALAALGGLLIACPPSLAQEPETVSQASQASSPIVLRVNPDDRRQTLSGFGASGAWWATWFDRLTPEAQEHALRLLYSGEGAGLDIHRYNIPAASDDRVTGVDRRTPDMETAPFEYALSRDARGIGIARRVRALGVTRFVAFANSPPARLTRNGTPSGGDGGGSNLKAGAEPEFARYLVDITELLAHELDVDQIELSPINEPQWDWGKDRRHQEGCHYTPAQVASVIRAVYDELDRRAAEADGDPRPVITVEAPESGSWSTSRPYAEALFADPVIAERLKAFAQHSYWSSAEDKRRFTAWFTREHPGREIRMTEYCEMRGDLDVTMRSGLHVARVIHDDLTIAGVTQWQWWLGLSAGRYCDGLVQCDRRDGSANSTKRLWVLANWSRFLDPGSVRIGLEGGGELAASAFLDATGEHLVVVVVNERDQPATVRLLGPTGPVRAGSRYVTDDAHDLEELPEAADANGASVIPPKSVVTLIAAVPMTGAAPAQAPDTR